MVFTLRLFYLITVFLTVATTTMIIYSIIKSAIDRYKQQYNLESIDDFKEMLLVIERGQLIILNISTTALFFVLGMSIFNWLFAIVLGLVGFFLPWTFIKIYRKRRLLKFETQLVTIWG